MSTENNVEKVIADLEQKGYESLQKVLKENSDGTKLIANTISGNTSVITESSQKQSLDNLGKGFMSIIENGSKEFEEKTGRKMTYAEMRSAWG